jgi:hypothetical protein
MESEMETTDVGLAAFVYSLGKEVNIQGLNERQCVFRFEDCPEMIEWQAGKAMVNVVTFLSAYRALLRRVKRLVT